MCQTNGTLFQAQLTQEVLKEQTKAAGEENKGNSREHGDGKVRAYYRTWEDGDAVDVMKERLLKYFKQHREYEL